MADDVNKKIKKILEETLGETTSRSNEHGGYDYYHKDEPVIMVQKVKEGYSIHLMPLYCIPSVDDAFMDKVKPWRKGKSCLTFKEGEIRWDIIKEILEQSSPYYLSK